MSAHLHVWSLPSVLQKIDDCLAESPLALIPLVKIVAFLSNVTFGWVLQFESNSGKWMAPILHLRPLSELSPTHATTLGISMACWPFSQWQCAFDHSRSIVAYHWWQHLVNLLAQHCLCLLDQAIKIWLYKNISIPLYLVYDPYSIVPQQNVDLLDLLIIDNNAVMPTNENNSK